MNKKKILSLALVVLLIATISFGTLAWFNASAEVVNKFYVASSDGEGTAPDFSISILEKVLGEENYAPEGNEYKDILPGDELSKSIKITNDGLYEQWVRIHVTFSDSETWQKAIAKAAADAEIGFEEFVIAHMISPCDRDALSNTVDVSYNAFGPDTMTFTFYIRNPLESEETFHFMETFTIPGILEQEDMDFGSQGFTLTVKAEAVQVANLDATDAKKAFELVGWNIGSEYGV